MRKFIEVIKSLSSCCRGDELFKQRAFMPNEYDGFLIECSNNEDNRLDHAISSLRGETKEEDTSLPMLDLTYEHCEEDEETEYYQQLVDDECDMYFRSKVIEIEMVSLADKKTHRIATIDGNCDRSFSNDCCSETQIQPVSEYGFNTDSQDEVIAIPCQENAFILPVKMTKRTIIITPEFIEKLRNYITNDLLHNNPWIRDDIFHRFVDWLEESGVQLFALRHIEDGTPSGSGMNIVTTPLGKWSMEDQSNNSEGNKFSQHQLPIRNDETNLGCLNKSQSSSYYWSQSHIPTNPDFEEESSQEQVPFFATLDDEVYDYIHSSDEKLPLAPVTSSIAEQSLIKFTVRKKSHLSYEKEKSRSLLKKIFSHNKDRNGFKKPKKKKSQFESDITPLDESFDTFTDLSTLGGAESLDSSHMTDFSPFSSPSFQDSNMASTSFRGFVTLSQTHNTPGLTGSRSLLSFLDDDDNDSASGSRSLQNAIDGLISCNILSPSPHDIAQFIQLYQHRIGPFILGDYLGRRGDSEDEIKFYELVRYNYTSSTSFAGMDVEQGLRHFLTKKGFHLPGESQMIDRLICTFARCYWEDNGGEKGLCQFKHQDTIYVLSFAIILLNTDLHKASSKRRGIIKTKNRRRKMTKNDFYNNIKGVEHSGGLSQEYLSKIYDFISKYPITLPEPGNKTRDIKVIGEKQKSSPHTKKDRRMKNPLSRHKGRFRRSRPLELSKV